MGKGKFFVDTYSESLFKKGEELCGDMVNVIRKPDETVLVLADGMGSGVKANILATLTSRIISTMLSGDADIDDCIETISNTLPVCSERGIAYSTFTIVRVKHSGEVYTAEFDGPEMVIVRDGILDEPEKTMRIIGGKEVWECTFMAEDGDMLISFSDGVIHAGIGRLVNLGWKRMNVVEYIQRTYEEGMSARDMTRALIGVCDDLYQGEAGDDTTVATVRIVKRDTTRVMVGPPATPEMDSVAVEKLVMSSGRKVVCGGTTSKIVARELGQEIEVELKYHDSKVPPTGYIKGIDLVTEGVLTLSAAEKILDKYIIESEDNKKPYRYLDIEKKDGASKLVKLLIDESSDIIFMIGTANNQAHQADADILSLDVKVRIVYSMAEKLRSLGKTVTIEEY